MTVRFTAITLAILSTSACSVLELPHRSDEKSTTPLADDNQTSQQAPHAVVGEICQGFGPQTPRDIASSFGENKVSFPLAPPASEMNLCNIHTHTNAEHKGPGFSVFVGDSEHGGYACNGSTELTAEELAPAPGPYKGVKPGDTIEVHWVHTSCDALPGPGLGSCVPQSCTNPKLRVEAQVFLVVNDPSALNFMDMVYQGHMANGKRQAKSLPTGTGTPIQFRGSTTGYKYSQSVCSPVKVTWNVRPQCAKLDINSLHQWAESGNVFEEKKSHGVRPLVTAPELLSPIE
ncbi:MAG: delta-class carbonic anhydrase [bacterium]